MRVALPIITSLHLLSEGGASKPHFCPWKPRGQNAVEPLMNVLNVSEIESQARLTLTVINRTVFQYVCSIFRFNTLLNNRGFS